MKNFFQFFQKNSSYIRGRLVIKFVLFLRLYGNMKKKIFQKIQNIYIVFPIFFLNLDRMTLEITIMVMQTQIQQNKK